MRVLVTGATGKAGRATVRALRDRFADLEVVTGRLPDPGPAWDGVDAAFVLSGFADPETAALAEKAGVRRVALLWGGYWGPVEEAFSETDLEWTSLQPASFLGNTTVWADAVRERGQVAEPFVDVAETMVHEGDVGAVALARALGRPLHLVELSEPEARQRWLAEGYDEALVDALVAWQQRPVAEATRVSPDVERVLGRPPLTLADWITEHVDAFR
jgi:uncharacterized protein YbjT (DUF2867 family)